METLNFEQRNKIELKLNELAFKIKKIFTEPLSLKMLCRNSIRFSMRSLSKNNMSILNLPKNLLNYLINN